MLKHSRSPEDFLIPVLFGLGLVGIVTGVIATLFRVW
jgi:hypothetical protein